MHRIFGQRVFGALVRLGLLTLMVSLVACSSTATATTTPTGHSSGSATATATAPATATPQLSCLQLVAGAMPFSGVSGIAGLQLPLGSYISAPTTSGGSVGQYTVQTYTLCFPGGETVIDGGNLTSSGTPTSAIGHLVHSGWTLNNLFPDPSSLAFLDYCSAPHICLNTAGTPTPFTFAGFDHFASQTGGYTTAHLEVASLATPICLNDVGYYAGTPKYTLYFDGNSPSGGATRAYHFQMPPGTRVSTFNGGGTAGSTYNFFCSAGSHDTVVSFLQQAMQNIGWSITATTTGFTATTGSNPTYRIALSIRYPNNYSLQVFIPM